MYWVAKKREAGPSAHVVRDEGVKVARCVVERLVRELGIAGVCVSRKRPRVTVVGADRSGDLLERDFTVDASNRRWVVDITYVDTAAGWVYTAFVRDLAASRRSWGA